MTGSLTLLGTPPLAIPAGAAAGLVATSDDSGNVSWVAAAGGSGGEFTPTAVKTSAYAAVAGDYVPCDTTSGCSPLPCPPRPPTRPWPA